MSVSFGKNKSKSESTSAGASQMLTADNLKGYTDRLNDMSGGRFYSFAKGGTPATTYSPLSASGVQGVGGLGATRLSGLAASRTDTSNRLQNDASLTGAQKTRAQQLADADFGGQEAGIRSETDASIAALASQENEAKYKAEAANNARALQDYLALAQIFFGGKGSNSASAGSGTSSASSFNVGAGMGSYGG